MAAVRERRGPERPGGSPLLSGRRLFPTLAVVVVTAQLVSLGSVLLLLSGASGAELHAAGRGTVLLVAVIYLLVAVPVTAVVGHRRQQPTRVWLAADRDPTPFEAGRALRLPADVAIVYVSPWLGGAAVIGGTAAAVLPDPWTGLRIGVATALGGLVGAGVVHLLTARVASDLTARALTTLPPGSGLALGVRSRLFVSWGLTSGVPLLGVVLLFLDPTAHDGPEAPTVVFLAVAGMAVGGLATALNSRAVARPLGELRRVVQQVADGEPSAGVLVDDAGEIGLLQDGVNRMVDGLAERERLRDLFGRHVGTTVAQQALATGVVLAGQERAVATLFVDIVGSTSLMRATGAAEMVGRLNRFFTVVVGIVESEGGLLNKFVGDAALGIFGAPAEHDDPAAAALRAARRIASAVEAAGEVEVGIGVSYGVVWAGQVGASSRLEYTVIGDAVNEASRLSELAKHAPGRVLASGAVVGEAGGEGAHWTPGAPVSLRGRGETTLTWARASPKADRGSA